MRKGRSYINFAFPIDDNRRELNVAASRRQYPRSLISFTLAKSTVCKICDRPESIGIFFSLIALNYHYIFIHSSINTFATNYCLIHVYFFLQWISTYCDTHIHKTGKKNCGLLVDFSSALIANVFESDNAWVFLQKEKKEKEKKKLIRKTRHAV